ncbi:MAG: three-Cys-motif partner protein TcmP [Candidatus Sericytochromatia bacterium]
MTVAHEFGGPWTEEKLDRIRKYLPAFLKIFRANQWARHYETVYVDAFAGTGHRADVPLDQKAVNTLFPEWAEAETQEFLKGSARIALEQDPAFKQYIVIDAAADHCTELEKLKDDFPLIASRINIHQADANTFLREWCEQTNWETTRAVVFLDPYGMQVDWATVEAIAKTKAIDLWLLFPLGAAINRLLTSGGLPNDGWSNALTRTLGTDAWKDAFYKPRQKLTLFGVEDVYEKDTNFEAIGQFFVDRLKSVFPMVAENPLPLRNSTNVPLYLLCFASANGTAAKIARDVLRPAPRR